jgi:NADPH2:quinone reductase
LVHGASGGVGIAAVQLARAQGLTIIGTAGTEASMKLVLQQGANHVFNHNLQDYLPQVSAITNDIGVDIIVEMLANVNLSRDFTVLAQSGCLVIIGSRGSIEINPRDAMMKEASMMGMTMWNATEREVKSIHSYVGASLDNGTIRPVIGKKLPLSEAAQAHHLIMESHAYGKIVLIP